MDEQQDSLNQDVNELPNDNESAPEQDNSGYDDEGNLAKDSDPLAIKKRLGMQAKKHQRELRAVKDELRQVYAQLAQSGQGNQSSMPQDQPASQGMSVEDQIQRGVRLALQAKEAEERKAKEAEQMAHVHKQYQRLNDEFDQASEKYDDFDNVVRGNDVPFTPAMRDALLFIDNPADVAYKLGKNRQELQRISQLHPLDQAREVNKLSFALMGGNGKASSASSNANARPMGAIKTNPANSQAITDKTPASVIRARMKAGSWK